MVLLNQKERDEELEKTLLELREDELFYNEPTCPICGSDDLVIQGRCTTCVQCGWSKCAI